MYAAVSCMLRRIFYCKYLAAFWFPSSRILHVPSMVQWLLSQRTQNQSFKHNGNDERRCRHSATLQESLSNDLHTMLTDKPSYRMMPNLNAWESALGLGKNSSP
ncbi:predicted protein [Sclerotinia sclerotiorum 1980 UF-70]|uniref:Uncharacterized protein n=1 Tax=Sclerotinia sclerotiorum (strain ATCC 18683 / 1980 / Ss-1) TaxID=665079 RepID=A7F0B2_SCLS1|nr:predicted protein [Sclerotinia sclerotiorum 1980 UF-70]EDN95154.1 predicted protein [Sclerotinia sclerotiorum 1980 UF-70]